MQQRRELTFVDKAFGIMLFLALLVLGLWGIFQLPDGKAEAQPTPTADLAPAPVFELYGLEGITCVLIDYDGQRVWECFKQ